MSATALAAADAGVSFAEAFVICLLVGALGLGVVLVIWLVIGALSLSARKTRDWWHERSPASVAPGFERTYGFPVGVHGVLPLGDDEIDGPGLYRVVGVARETCEDVVLHVEAATLANARVKAELKGVIVTQIDKRVAWSAAAATTTTAHATELNG